MRSSQLLTGIIILLLASAAQAKDWQVKMLSFGEQGPMVFEPAFLKANVGDTVTFIPTDPGHHVQSYLVPDGQEAWASKLNETYSITLVEEGVQLYYCPPHLVMGMVGIIQVGDAVNQAALDSAYENLRTRIALNPERVDQIVNQVK
ncbi:pseudoazurin [Marinomonas piezotolerans]|uniref:Pseudoazurin n=1 Tax=Marinomonas piezotolerans TaxID=2213058 RepID=A0A370U5M7_9GAMM|nr:pseudoazurin [Marinomonas piezotolerans]RDL43089.1 pseudoazurin [Marinomonas piezotolerans]